MLSEEKLRTLPPIPQAYWRKAQEFVAKNQTEWFVVEPKMPEWAQWMAYFDRQGWKPFGVREVERGRTKTFLVPSRWPEWFDSEHAASKKILASQDF